MYNSKIGQLKRIALVAHDNKKQDLIFWVNKHKPELMKHKLFGTGTTAGRIHDETGVEITPLLSGPLGGDQQIGAMIALNELDLMVFFWDPLSAQPHDPDVKALLRIAVLYDIPVAMNFSTADFILKSECFNHDYEKMQP